MENEKETYISPALIVYGDVEVITQGSQTGSFLDASFPAGTPFRNITLS
jgi:hypothetical protein